MDVNADDDAVRTGTFAPGDFEQPTAAVGSVSDIDDIGDLMLPDDVDEVSTKLDLARAFIDMGDTEGARGSLEEVLSEGNEEQKAEATSLLEQI
jgi:pilus assembly protein FimV